MFYGKLFKKYMEIFGDFNFSSNKVSGLKKSELIMMAHNLYQHFPSELDHYWTISDKELIEKVYNILKKI